MNPLLTLKKIGQSVWYDNLRKGLITSGELRRLMEEYGLTGVSSNLNILEKGINGTTEYDEDIQRCSEQGLGGPEILKKITARDVKLAADILEPVYKETDGMDGYVCFDIRWDLVKGHDKALMEAKAFYSLVNKPNIMMRVPCFAGWTEIIEELTFEGYKTDVVFIFSPERYEEAAQAYIRGLERRAKEGEPLGGVVSVASFLLSRIDTLVDKKIDERAEAASSNDEKARLRGLLGKAAIANAKLAFLKYREIFGGPGFKKLKEQGAVPQRLVWASTSTKDPRYPDTRYVEELIEPETISIMPIQTLLAFYSHGKVRQKLSEDIDGAKKVFSELLSLGIDYSLLVPELEADGIKRAAEAYASIIRTIEDKGKDLHAKMGYAVKYSLSGFEAPLSKALEEIGDENFLERLWAKDPSIWKKGPEEKKLIRDALGWLTLPDLMEDNRDVITSFAKDIKEEGYTIAVLLGMGGSSLAPLVFSEVFGRAQGYPELIVLDSTDPDAVRYVTEKTGPEKALFIVSSKSGSTIEPLSLFEHFYQLLYAKKREAAGRDFMAITDPGTPLEGFARKYRFRKIFINPHDIGGRFSALSYFGLVPAALIGVDISRLLRHASNISAATHPCIKEKENPVVMLGAALGILGKSGKDKVTFFLPKELESLGLWIEQLIAESTGKEGKGLIPIVNEPPGAIGDYGDDRVFIHISSAHEDRKLSHTLKELASAGHPVISFRLKDIYELGGEFLRWEVATAVAGQVLGINPFDQPDVELAKRLTRARLHALDKTGGAGALVPPGVEVRGNGVRAFFGKSTFESIRAHARGNGDLKSAMRGFLGLVKKGDYVSILAYYDPLDEKTGKSFTGLRKTLRDSTKAATQFGYGPRYLHSTGQLHKGGSNKGVFIILCHETEDDVPIPKSAYSFSELELSQAFGDMEALDSKGCRVALMELEDSSIRSLEEAEKLIKAALQAGP